MLGQSIPLAEIIVVDDGSNDETREVVKRFDDRVRYIYQQNAGGGAARNRGVEQARTPWVAFLDSDDLWTADHLERIVRAITRTCAGADLYFDDTSYRTPRESRTKWEHTGFVVEGEHLSTDDGTAWMMLDNQPVMLQTSVVRRSSFLEIGGFWEELRTAHDTHFFLRLGIGRPACAVAGIGAIQTEDDGLANRLTAPTGPVKLSRWINTARLFKDILDHYPHLAPEYQTLLRRRVCEARWRTSRVYWGKGDIFRSLGEAWLSFQSQPRIFAGKFLPRRQIIRSLTKG